MELTSVAGDFSGNPGRIDRQIWHAHFPNLTSIIDRVPDAIDPGRLVGRVEFKDVSFSYDGRNMAAADLNFTVMPGDTVARPIRPLIGVLISV